MYHKQSCFDKRLRLLWLRFTIALTRPVDVHYSVTVISGDIRYVQYALLEKRGKPSCRGRAFSSGKEGFIACSARVLEYLKRVRHAQAIVVYCDALRQAGLFNYFGHY